MKSFHLKVFSPKMGEKYVQEEFLGEESLGKVKSIWLKSERRVSG